MTALRKPTRLDRVKRATSVDWHGFAHPKCPPSRDPKFRAWTTRTHPCVIRGKKGHVCGPRVGTVPRPVMVFGHVPTGGKRGVAMKGDDVGGGVAMCGDAHFLQHEIGWPAFEKRFGINARALAIEIGEEWKRKNTK